MRGSSPSCRRAQRRMLAAPRRARPRVRSGGGSCRRSCPRAPAPARPRPPSAPGARRCAASSALRLDDLEAPARLLRGRPRPVPLRRAAAAAAAAAADRRGAGGGRGAARGRARRLARARRRGGEAAAAAGRPRATWAASARRRAASRSSPTARISTMRWRETSWTASSSSPASATSRWTSGSSASPTCRRNGWRSGRVSRGKMHKPTIARLAAALAVAGRLARARTGCASFHSLPPGAASPSSTATGTRRCSSYMEPLAAEPGNVAYRAALLRAKITASQAHFEKGKQYHEAGVPERALIEYQQAVELDPTNQYAAGRAREGARASSRRSAASAPTPRDARRDEARSRGAPAPAAGPRAALRRADLARLPQAGVGDGHLPRAGQGVRHQRALRPRPQGPGDRDRAQGRDRAGRARDR